MCSPAFVWAPAWSVASHLASCASSTSALSSTKLVYLRACRRTAATRACVREVRAGSDWGFGLVLLGRLSSSSLCALAKHSVFEALRRRRLRRIATIRRTQPSRMLKMPHAKIGPSLSLKVSVDGRVRVDIRQRARHGTAAAMLRRLPATGYKSGAHDAECTKGREVQPEVQARPGVFLCSSTVATCTCYL